MLDFYVNSPSKSSVATICPEGYYCPSSGSRGAASATICPPGHYCPAGAEYAQPCGTGNFDPAVSGVPSLNDCVCAESWAGSNCDQFECPSTLEFVSLGLLLIEASYPEELRESGNEEERTASQWTTHYRVNSILRTADSNGDDFLSVGEATAALDAVDLTVPETVRDLGLIWARPTSSLASYALWEYVYNSSLIEHMVTDAVSQYVSTGTFYGYLGSDTPVTSLHDTDATYPNSTWTEDKCIENINAGVTLTWSFTTENAALYQQCGYVNGEKVPKDKFSDQLVSATDSDRCTASDDGNGRSVTTCNFDDPDNIAVMNRKRFYCIDTTFCSPGDSLCTSNTTNSSLGRVMCSTGLLYDGRPADVFPSCECIVFCVLTWSSFFSYSYSFFLSFFLPRALSLSFSTHT